MIKVKNLSFKFEQFFENCIISQVEDREFDKSGFLTYLHGRAYTLYGICLALCGQRANAMQNFYKTCGLYGIHFPKK